MTTARRQRLGALARARRRQLGLTIVAAAAAAGVSRGTWEALEEASRRTRDAGYAGIERALRWRHGSIEAILHGGDPTPLPGTPGHEDIDPDVDPDTGVRYTDPDERDLWRLDRLPAEERRTLIAFLRTLRQQRPTSRRQAS